MGKACPASWTFCSCSWIFSLPFLLALIVGRKESPCQKVPPIYCFYFCMGSCQHTCADQLHCKPASRKLHSRQNTILGHCMYIWLLQNDVQASCASKPAAWQNQSWPSQRELPTAASVDCCALYRPAAWRVPKSRAPCNPGLTKSLRQLFGNDQAACNALQR